MALIIPIYSKAKHVNSYWTLTDFKMTLEKITLTVSGYKNKQARESRSEVGDAYFYSFPINKEDPDLVAYNTIKITYDNSVEMKIGIDLDMKITAKNVIPNINKLVDKLLRYGYTNLKQEEVFKRALDG